MGYDVQFVQIDADDAAFPVEGKAAQKLLKTTVRFKQPEQVKKSLLALAGARPGPDDSVDYLGAGLSYARLHVKAEGIHVDNNLNSKELIKIYEALRTQFPTLLIHDLQSGNLHDAESFAAWWTRPL